MILNCAGKTLDLSVPKVMGIVNVTEDSFSDGGTFFDPKRAIAHAWAMVNEGAAIIDIGGESTRPGAQTIGVQEELDRVLPIIETLAAELPVPVSIDTSKPEVMRAAVAAGAGMVNDVYALRQPGALAAAADLGVPVCLMHMQGEPRSMQRNPHYTDVVAEVGQFLAARVQAGMQAGIARDRLLIDPGFGFGKNLQHNLRLLKNLTALHALGLPLLVGLSRKSMLGTILNKPVDERLYAGLAAHALALWQGAHVVRVHDVAATVDALKLVQAVRCVEPDGFSLEQR